MLVYSWYSFNAGSSHDTNAPAPSGLLSLAGSEREPRMTRAASTAAGFSAGRSLCSLYSFSNDSSVERILLCIAVSTWPGLTANDAMSGSSFASVRASELSAAFEQLRQRFTYLYGAHVGWHWYDELLVTNTTRPLCLRSSGSAARSVLTGAAAFTESVLSIVS